MPWVGLWFEVTPPSLPPPLQAENIRTAANPHRYFVSFLLLTKLLPVAAIGCSWRFLMQALIQCAGKIKVPFIKNSYRLKNVNSATCTFFIKFVLPAFVGYLNRGRMKNSFRCLKFTSRNCLGIRNNQSSPQQPTWSGGNPCLQFDRQGRTGMLSERER